MRPPRPCRPSKFRFEVDAQRSPASSLSSFMARHIEQPGSRHSKPEAIKTLSKPSSSACCLISPEPGTIIALMPSLTVRPSATAAAARKSSIRLLVHEPINTVSILISVSFMPALSPIYSSARSTFACRAESVIFLGSGTCPVIGRASSGLVPQVTVGTISSAFRTTSVSYFAPSSEGRLFHHAKALSQAAPVGAIGLPLI